MNEKRNKRNIESKSEKKSILFEIKLLNNINVFFNMFL